MRRDFAGRTFLGAAVMSALFATGGGAFAQTLKVATPAPAPPNSAHPLEPVLRFAREQHEHLQRRVQDYTCRIVKRERIDGVLQSTQFIRAKVRPAVAGSGESSRPLAVYLEFQAPAKIAGRRVLFVEGAQEGRMLVRQRAGGITLHVNVDGGLAARESTMPITYIGFHTMLRETIAQMEEDMAADPTGENTRVEWFENAAIDGSPCTAIRVTHPRRAAGLDYYTGRVFIDKQTHLPVHLDYYDWPATESDKPILLAEFTYRDVQINVRLTDADFDPVLLGFQKAK